MNHKSNAFLILIMLMLLLTSSLIPAGSTNSWEINTIDQGSSSRIIGADPTIKIDSNSNLHIVYRETINETSHILKYAKQEQGNWKTKTIPTNGSSDYVSFTLDSNDIPHICYREVHDLIDWWLVYTTLNEEYQWITEDIDKSMEYITGAHSSIVTDSNNIPYVSYYEGLAHDLRYAVKTNQGWTIQKVDYDKHVGIYTSIALTKSNKPCITYVNRDAKNLKYASWDGIKWTTEIIDEEGDVGEGSSLCLDENDHPHVCYHDETNHTIKYAYFDGDTWNTETIDSNNVLSSCTSLQLDDNGLPHIAYVDQSISDVEYWLKYAYKDMNGTWHITVISNEYLALYTSLALDDNGNPHIAYLANYSLKYAGLNVKSVNKNDTPGFLFIILILSMLIIVSIKKNKNKFL